MAEQTSKTEKEVKPIEELKREAIAQKLMNRVKWGLSTPFSGKKATAVRQAMIELVKMGYDRKVILAEAVGTEKAVAVLDWIEKGLPVEEAGQILEEKEPEEEALDRYQEKVEESEEELEEVEEVVEEEEEPEEVEEKVKAEEEAEGKEVKEEEAEEVEEKSESSPKPKLKSD